MNAEAELSRSGRLCRTLTCGARAWAGRGCGKTALCGPGPPGPGPDRRQRVTGKRPGRERAGNIPVVAITARFSGQEARADIRAVEGLLGYLTLQKASSVSENVSLNPRGQVRGPRPPRTQACGRGRAGRIAEVACARARCGRERERERERETERLRD